MARRSIETNTNCNLYLIKMWNKISCFQNLGSKYELFQVCGVNQICCLIKSLQIVQFLIKLLDYIESKLSFTLFITRFIITEAWSKTLAKHILSHISDYPILLINQLIHMITHYCQTWSLFHFIEYISAVIEYTMSNFVTKLINLNNN